MTTVVVQPVYALPGFPGTPALRTGRRRVWIAAIAWVQSSGEEFQMTTFAEPISPPNSRPFRLDSISWEGYEDVLRAVGDQFIYITFDRGRMELMSHSPSHELYKELIGGLIDVLVIEKSILLIALG
jgi:hypothetical protein